jgi:hypothetical protein
MTPLILIALFCSQMYTPSGDWSKNQCVEKTLSCLGSDFHSPFVARVLDKCLAEAVGIKLPPTKQVKK